MNIKSPEDDKNKISSTSPLLSLMWGKIKERKVTNHNKNGFSAHMLYLFFINLYCLDQKSAYIYVLICLNI